MRLGKLRDELSLSVFGVSAGITIVFVVFAGIFTERAGALFETLQEAATELFGWLFVVAVIVFLSFCLWLIFGPHADRRLGPDDSSPDFSNVSWFAMLFSAGMGIGLLYWGVAEPLSFYATDAPRAEEGTAEAARDAMLYALHHWGFAPWGIYAVVGLGLAYFGYRRDRPLAIRSLFWPLIGDRVEGWAGDAVDIAATVGTLFGVATSLGLGVMQLNAGLDHLFGIGVSPLVQLLLIALVTGIATVSVLVGLDAGIQRLSQANLLLAGSLLLFVLVVGATADLLAAYVSNVGGYLGELADIMSQTGTYEDVGWLSNWTLFYWAWWISWSPFVGMFIARVSRGRTVREFVLGVLLVPSLVSFLWFTVLGNTAIQLEQAGAQLADVLDVDEALALFVLLDELPLAAVTSLVALALVLSFFVTSSDSGSYVIGILTAGGDEDPPTAIRVFWAIAEGLVAAALVVAGGLTALQAGAIATGLPFTVVMLFGVWGIARGLGSEEEKQKGPRRFPAVHIADVAARERAFRAWEARLREEQRELDEEERSLEQDREDLEDEREALEGEEQARFDRQERGGS